MLYALDMIFWNKSKEVDPLKTFSHGKLCSGSHLKYIFTWACLIHAMNSNLSLVEKANRKSCYK